MTSIWEPSSEVLAACNKVAKMSVDEFVAACSRAGVKVQWSHPEVAARYLDPADPDPGDDGYWSLYDVRGERVAEA